MCPAIGPPSCACENTVLHAEATAVQPVPAAPPAQRQVEPGAPGPSIPNRTAVAASPRPGPPAQQTATTIPRLSPRAQPVGRPPAVVATAAAAIAATPDSLRPWPGQTEQAPHREQSREPAGPQMAAPSTARDGSGAARGLAGQTPANGLPARHQQDTRRGGQIVSSPRSHTEPPPRYAACWWNIMRLSCECFLAHCSSAVAIRPMDSLHAEASSAPASAIRS